MFFMKDIMSASTFRTTLCLLLLLCGFTVQAQTDLLSRTVDTSRTVEKYGPNRLFYAQGMLGMSLVTDKNMEGAELKSGSFSWYIGMRMKLKLWRWDDLTLDLLYRHEQWELKQDTGKLLPDANLHDLEQLRMNNIEGRLCNRLDLNKRGNIIASYLDFGVYGDYTPMSVHVTRDVFVDPVSSGSDKIRSRSTGLSYVQPFNYGGVVRFGYNYMAIQASYRMTDMFRSYRGAVLPELPRLMIGLEISFSD